MADPGQPLEHDATRTEPSAVSRVSRAHVLKDIVGSLSKLPSIRGGLLVTPDGLVITADLPARVQVEALAALGATLGRELEVGTARLGRGVFKMALFAADSGTLFVGGSRVGFLILLGDRNADPSSVRVALSRAIDRLQH
jgi:predicted regulator of Ras-like GTPase activity (Roadblock/LC7/MglB family)